MMMMTVTLNGWLRETFTPEEALEQVLADPGRGWKVETVSTFDCAEAEALAATLPKFLRAKVARISCHDFDCSPARYWMEYAVFIRVSHTTDVTGHTNEAGLKKIRRFLSALADYRGAYAFAR